MKLFKMSVLCMMIFLAGCSSNSQPTCSDETVKKLVLDITAQELFKGMLLVHLQQNYKKIIEETENSDVYKEYQKIDYQGEGFVYGTMPIENFLKFVPISKTAAAVKAIIDNQIKQLNITFTGIRTADFSKETKKISCESNLVLSNGKSHPIKYTAQLTEDKQVWVQVTGL